MRSAAHSIIGDQPEGRPLGDFYPTPAAATHALLNHIEIGSRSDVIWEPACGDGAISKILIDRGHTVCSSDLYNRGYGTPGIDFLFDWEKRADIIITNPPYKFAEMFLEHALVLGVGKIYMLLKLSFLEGDRRSKLLESSPLAHVYVFRKRLTMTRNGEKMANSGMIAFAWYEWLQGWDRRPEIRWI